MKAIYLITGTVILLAMGTVLAQENGQCCNAEECTPTCCTDKEDCCVPSCCK